MSQQWRQVPVEAGRPARAAGRRSPAPPPPAAAPKLPAKDVPIVRRTPPNEVPTGSVRRPMRCRGQLARAGPRRSPISAGPPRLAITAAHRAICPPWPRSHPTPVPPDEADAPQAATAHSSSRPRSRVMTRSTISSDAPEISDADYDALRARNAAIEARFPELVRADSPSRARRRRAASRRSARCATTCRCCRSATPSTSDDVADFVERVRRFLGSDGRRCRWCSPPSPRSTGCRSRSATRTGELVQAATRGDGTEGENVTANIRTITGDPAPAEGPRRARR